MRIIGSLLVMAILSKPAIIRIDILAYEFYKSNSSIISLQNSVKEEPIQENYTERDIEQVMTDISDNKRHISQLLSKKKDSVKALQNIMEEKAKNKVCLNSEQIERFGRFTRQYEMKKEDLLLSIERLNRMDLNDIQKQMLHSETDYDYLYNKFESMSKNQTEVIDYLTAIIDEANETIRMLC